MYSAIKVDGKKLYDLAREGKTIKRKSRSVTISELTILSWDNPTVTVDVVCSSGTYIRSLAYDIGQALGVGAYLSGLERIRSGNFHIDNTVTLDTVMSDESWHTQIISPHIALNDRPSVTLQADEIDLIRNGQFIPRPDDITTEHVFAFSENEELIAILTPREHLWKPHKVFSR